MNYIDESGQLSFFLKKIKRKEYFSFIKHNHGLWDKLRICVPHIGFYNRKTINIRKISKIYSDYKQPGGHIVSQNIINECLYFMANMHKFRNNIFLGLSATGNTSTCDKKRTRKSAKIWELFLRENSTVYDGLIWKRAALSGRLLELFCLIKDKKVIIVSPSQEGSDPRYKMSLFGKRFGISDFTHIEISEKNASKDFNIVIGKLVNLCKNKKVDKVILFKAGPVGSAIISRLHNKLDRTYMIDIGNALDVLDPTIKRNWTKGYKDTLRYHYGRYYVE
jgi:hypothetical protein